MTKKKASTADNNRPKSSSTNGGSLVGTAIVTIEAVSIPVFRLRIVFATQFCMLAKPLVDHSVYDSILGSYSYEFHAGYFCVGIALSQLGHISLKKSSSSYLFYSSFS